MMEKMAENANINSPYTAKTVLGAPKEKLSDPFTLRKDRTISTSTAEPIKSIDSFSDSSVSALSKNREISVSHSSALLTKLLLLLAVSGKI